MSEQLDFYRLCLPGDEDAWGPLNHRELNEIQQALAAQLRQRWAECQLISLDELTDGQPNNWRSGTIGREGVERTFGELLPQLLAAGFELRRYNLSEEELLIEGDQAAAYVEALLGAAFEKEKA